MMKHISAIVLLSLSIMTACVQKESLKKSTLYVTHTELSFNFKESSYAITVKSEEPWSLSCNETWVSPSLSSAENSATITISVSQNDGAEREATLRFTNSVDECLVHLTQAADTRNYLDITLDKIPESYERIEAAQLIIPYRKGMGAKLDKLSATVTGKARGSIAVESVQNITLNEAEGEIRLPVSGRAGEAGTLLFTVAGLPPTVFGEAAQCMLEVKEGESLAEISIEQLKTQPEGKLNSKSRIKGVVSSVNDKGFTLQDKDKGILVQMHNAASEIKCGDESYIYIKGCELKSSNGIKVLTISGIGDIQPIAGNIPVLPKLISSLDLDNDASVLCKITGCQAESSELSKNSVKGISKMECRGWNFSIYADFDAPFPQGYGFVTGIVGTDDSANPVLILRDKEDIAGLNEARINVNAKFELDRYEITVPAEGSTSISFQLLSSVDWYLSSDDSGWLSGWSQTSGSASDTPVTISVCAAKNELGRRKANVRIMGKDVSDILLTITQLEGKSILDQDFSLVKESLESNPKYYPNSSGTEISKQFASYGLDGWYASVAYTAISSKDDGVGVLRIGKTSVKGYIQTPKLKEIGKEPTNIEVRLLGGKYKNCVADWIGVEIEGPGALVAGDDLMKLESYEDKYKSSLITNLPVYLLHDFDNSAMKRVVFKIEGATEDTVVRFTATTKGSSNAAECNMFFVGDIHIGYAD